MIRASVAVMILTLRRDVPALLLAFALPPLVFLVFTAVFREASTRPPAVSVAVLEMPGASDGPALSAALSRGGLRVLRPPRAEQDLRDRVSAGSVDVGIVRRAAAAVTASEPELLVLAGRGSAADLVRARLAEGGRPRLAGSDLPDAAGPTVLAPSHGDPAVLREVGAVVALFLMLAAIQTSMALVDERASGIHERLACGGDASGLVLGKLVFGLLLGVAQAALILLTAAVAFGADPLTHPAWMAVGCALASVTATSLTLLVASACSTRHQAQTISTFAVLTASAVGGSMVPSSLMPDDLARIGRLTPTAWMIEALDAATGLADVPSHAPYAAWSAMACFTILATLLASWAIRRPSVL